MCRYEARYTEKMHPVLRGLYICEVQVHDEVFEDLVLDTDDVSTEEFYENIKIFRIISGTSGISGISDTFEIKKAEHEV